MAVNKKFAVDCLPCHVATIIPAEKRKGMFWLAISVGFQCGRIVSGSSTTRWRRRQ